MLQMILMLLTSIALLVQKQLVQVSIVLILQKILILILQKII